MEPRTSENAQHSGLMFLHGRETDSKSTILPFSLTKVNYHEH